MSSKVAVDEGEILQLFRDYLQESGNNECLASFEKTTNTVPLGLPSELCWLRELVLGGSWEEVLFFLKALNNTGDEKGYNECNFEVVKQHYLETIEIHTTGTAPHGDRKREENDRMQLLMQLLQKLEQLCLTKDSYKSLCSLVTLPSLSTNQEYSSWDKYTSRLECFYTVGRWVSHLLYPDMEFKAPPLQSLNKRVNVSNRLTQLVCKGLLFEKCESMCAQRCGERELQQGTEILDLCSWIQHQPDSAFQVTPLKIRLVVVPDLGTESTESSSENSHISRSVSITGNGSQGKPSPIQRLSSQSVPELQAVVDSPNRSMADPPLRQKRSLWHKAPKTSGPSLEVESEHTDSGHTIVPSSGNTDPAGEESHTIQHTQEDGALLRSQATVEENKPNDQKAANGLNLNFSSDFTPNVKATHKPRLGRDSSTPKPVGFRSKLTTQSSPMASPVQHVTNTPQRSSRPHVEQQLVVPPGIAAKKCIDFNNQDQSVQLPSVVMLSKVTDTQVVRSVAFSQFGKLVAIGANSKTLRVCLTDPLLQRTPSNEELPVYYYHPRYHRGSIYCMAWFDDNLLASGSNDQIIRLLSYNPELPVPCKTQGHLNIHNGTIRDIVFTGSTKLASGGAGDPVIKLTDCNTKQTVSVYSGHTDQILALLNVQHNVIASGSQDKTIKLWDLRQKSSFNTVELSGAALSLTATDNRLASSHLDGSCTIHDLFSLKPLATYNAHSDECRTLRFSPNGGRWLLSGSYDGSVCICDTGSLEWQQVGQHGDKVVQCRWHCRGDIFASTGADKMACFWILNDS